jgi:hypothetical protein
MSMNMEVLKASGQNIPAETLKKLEQAYDRMMAGVQGMGMVWQVGKQDQPLFSGIATAFHTKDAPKYLAEYEKSIASMNEIFKELNVPFLPAYELKKANVNGKPALEVSMDFGAAFGGLPEEAQGAIKKMFGPDGKMIMALTARDEQTVIMRYSKADGLKDALGSGKGLAGDPSLMKIAKGFPPAGAQWGFYFSPKGATEFADRAVKAFLPIPLNIPQFAETPPIAAAARIDGEAFELHVVVPAGVVDNAAEFIEQLKRAFGGGV